MQVAILRETQPGEKRVAASPDTVKKMVEMGLKVAVEAGAGEWASIQDEEYKSAGASIAKDAGAALKGATIILKVQGPDVKEIAKLPKGAFLIGLLNPLGNKDLLKTYAKYGLNAVALELVPRITRAQSMDVLSSQSNLAGYRSVIDAAAEFNRVFPMMMTAAGTVAPARILILGAGVAGLQAIATAKRLGAIVSAFDVRAAAKEQVESLGATFIEVESKEETETAGGYAKETSKEYQKRQSQLIHQTLKNTDIVITTALIPGKPAPTLITEAMVKDMKFGSIIVDMAAIAGGNCPLTEADKVVIKHGVKILGDTNIMSSVAMDASLLYARNILSFLKTIVDAETGTMKVDFDDEIIKSTLLTHQGKVIHG